MKAKTKDEGRPVLNKDQVAFVDIATDEATLLERAGFGEVLKRMLSPQRLEVPEAQLDLPIPKKAGAVVAALILSGDKDKINVASGILDTLHELAAVALRRSLLGKPNLQFRPKKPAVHKK